jgi:hypothetical protein
MRSKQPKHWHALPSWLPATEVQKLPDGQTLHAALRIISQIQRLRESETVDRPSSKQGPGFVDALTPAKA